MAVEPTIAGQWLVPFLTFAEAGQWRQLEKACAQLPRDPRERPFTDNGPPPPLVTIHTMGSSHVIVTHLLHRKETITATTIFNQTCRWWRHVAYDREDGSICYGSCDPDPCDMSYRCKELLCLENCPYGRVQRGEDPTEVLRGFMSLADPYYHVTHLWPWDKALDLGDWTISGGCVGLGNWTLVLSDSGQTRATIFDEGRD